MPRFDQTRPHSSSPRSVFSVHSNTAVTLVSGTPTQVGFDTADFTATGTPFDLVNDQYIPTQAGKYQLNVSAFLTSTAAMTAVSVQLRKNGSIVARYDDIGGSDTQVIAGPTAVQQMNGSTDTLQVWVSVTSTGTITLHSTAVTSFSGFWVGP